MPKDYETIELYSGSGNQVETIDVELKSSGLTVKLDRIANKPRSDWQTSGNCHNSLDGKLLPKDFAFEDSATDTFIKREVCLDCPVRIDCLETGLTTFIDQTGGYWGGFNHLERQFIADQRLKSQPLTMVDNNIGRQNSEGQSSREASELMTIESQLDVARIKVTVAQILKTLSDKEFSARDLHKLLLHHLAIDLSAVKRQGLLGKKRQCFRAAKNSLRSAGIIEVVPASDGLGLVNIWRLTAAGQQKINVKPSDQEKINQIHQDLEAEIKLSAINVASLVCQILSVVPSNQAYYHELKSLTINYLDLDLGDSRIGRTLSGALGLLARKGYVQMSQVNDPGVQGRQQHLYQLTPEGQLKIIVDADEKNHIQQLHWAIRDTSNKDGQPSWDTPDTRMNVVEMAIIEVLETFQQETIDDRLLWELVGDCFNPDLISPDKLNQLFDLAKNNLQLKFMIESIEGDWQLTETPPIPDLIGQRQELEKKINHQAAQTTILRILTTLPETKFESRILKDLFNWDLLGINYHQVEWLGLKPQLSRVFSVAKATLRRRKIIKTEKIAQTKSYLWSITEKGQKMHPQPADSDQIIEFYQLLVAPLTVGGKERMLAQLPNQGQTKIVILEILSALTNNQCEAKILRPLLVYYLQVDDLLNQLYQANLLPEWSRVVARGRSNLIEKQLIDALTPEDQLGKIYRLKTVRPIAITGAKKQFIRQLYDQMKYNLTAEIKTDLPSVETVSQLILTALQQSRDHQITTSQISWLTRYYLKVEPQLTLTERYLLTGNLSRAKRTLIDDQLIKFQSSQQVNNLDNIYQLSDKGKTIPLQPDQIERFNAFISQTNTKLITGWGASNWGTSDLEIAQSFIAKFSQTQPEQPFQDPLTEVNLELIDRINQAPNPTNQMVKPTNLDVMRSLIRVIRALPENQLDGRFIFDLVAIDLGKNPAEIKGRNLSWSANYLYNLINDC